MGRLNDVQRNQAVGMITGGMSYHEVAHRMNSAPSTIMRLVERHIVTGPVKDRERPGRQRVTSAREDCHIVLLHLHDRFRTATQTARVTWTQPAMHQSKSSEPCLSECHVKRIEGTCLLLKDVVIMNSGASSICDGLSSSGRVLSLLKSRDSALICTTLEKGFGVVGVNVTLLF